MDEIGASGESAHPLSKIAAEKCYEWMLADCASLNASRQARQDGLIDTITQISSAAILAIPGFLFASGATVPTVSESPALYVGVVLFVAALIAAMAEQHFSVLAYSKQIEVTQAYYLKESSDRQDIQSRLRVKAARGFAYSFFLLAVLLSSIGLFFV